MSYTYLREPGAESSAESFRDIAPFVQSRLIHSAGPYYLPDSETALCPGFPSGMMSGPLTGIHGAESSILCRADSPARTLAAQVAGSGSTVRNPDSGVKWQELYVRFDPVIASWKTHRCLFEEVVPESSVILPPWGMVHDGVLWERATPAPFIDGTDYGLSGFGTPTAKANQMAPSMERATRWRTPTARGRASWPTPTARDWKDGSASSCANVPPNGLLGRVIHMFPTPRTRGLDGCAHARARLREIDEDLLADGKLNPDWVEWLMCWPVGWTTLDRIPMMPRWRNLTVREWRSWEPVGRTTHDANGRAQRLRAIGNGQVPHAVAMAWNFLKLNK